MIIIPAIDLINGQCVRLYKGDYAKEKVYDNSPSDRAKLWEKGGAELIHIVDLEGARSGEGANFKAVKEIRGAVSCQLEIGGGIRSIEDAKRYLDIGIERVILGTAAYKNPALVSELANEYPNRIILGADAKDGKVAVDGWQESGAQNVFEFAATFNKLSLAGVLFTDVETDGALKGPNIPAQVKMGSIIDNPLIASGGISSLMDIQRLAQAGINNLYGVIVGTALYEEKFTLSEAIQEASKW